MRTSEERVAAPRRRRARLAGTAACAACLAVAVLLALGVSRLPVRTDAAMEGASASIFSGNPSLRYFVIVIVALALGATVTVFCHRLGRRTKDGEKRDDRKS